MMGNERSDERIIREFWNITKKHKNVEDPNLKFIKINSEIYNREIVSPSGDFIGNKSWFLVFITPQSQYC